MDRQAPHTPVSNCELEDFREIVRAPHLLRIGRDRTGAVVLL